MRLSCLTLILFSACRPVLDPPTYPSLSDGSDTADSFLPTSSFTTDTARLSIGVFYEGNASETIAIDGISTHYYIYDNTYTELTSSDRIEGLESARLILGSSPWWGGGIHWDSPHDLSEWTEYTVGFKSTAPVLSAFDIGLTGGGVEVRLAAADYGWAADGAWHQLRIPMADFAAGGADLSSVEVGLLLIGESTEPDAELLIDNVFLTQE